MASEIVYLGLGTNLGNRHTNLEQAVAAIRHEIGEVTSLSSFIETTPWGFASEHIFLNAVVEVKTILPPHQLLAVTQQIEQQMGRKQKSVDGCYADRIIDIDILFYGAAIIHTTDLVIPHPQIIHRDFVLEPLCEIAPEWIHPVYGVPLRLLKKTDGCLPLSP